MNLSLPLLLTLTPTLTLTTHPDSGEYIIYTALAWRKKSFGNALDFVWALDSGEYAVRENPASVRAACSNLKL